MKKRISLTSIAIVLVITVLSVIAIRSNTRPTIYVGLILSGLGVLLIGLFSDRYIGAISGGLVFVAGYYARILYPAASTLKDDKLEAFLAENAAFNETLGKYLIAFILLFIVIGFISGILGENLQKEREKLFSANKLTYMAIFVALSVIINTMRVGSVSFGGFPIILSGYLLGPIPGFIVGGVADLVAFLVRPSSFGFNPIFTLTSALTGLIPIVVTNLLGDRYPNFGFIKVLIGIFVGQMLTSVIMVPIFSVILYGANTFLVLATSAFLKQAFSIPIYAFLVATLSDRITKVIDFDKQFI